MIVVDASTVVAALLAAGQGGDDAREVMLGDDPMPPTSSMWRCSRLSADTR